MVEAGKGERERERENVRVCEGRKKKARLGFSREEEGRKEAIKQAEKRRGRYLSLLVFNRREEKERKLPLTFTREREREMIQFFVVVGVGVGH